MLSASFVLLILGPGFNQNNGGAIATIKYSSAINFDIIQTPVIAGAMLQHRGWSPFTALNTDTGTHIKSTVYYRAVKAG